MNEVHPFYMWSLRVLYALISLFVGFDSWSGIVGHKGPWDPMKAVAVCMFASYSLLSILGVFRPLKMLPLILFMIVYKTTWLAVVAYPLWAANQLAGSPAEGMARVFRWVAVAILIVPWGYVWRTYVTVGAGTSAADPRQFAGLARPR